MKAQISPRIDLVNRTKLEEVIPLDTPFVVFVDPSDACNFKCKFFCRLLSKDRGRKVRATQSNLLPNGKVPDPASLRDETTDSATEKYTAVKQDQAPSR